MSLQSLLKRKASLTTKMKTLLTSLKDDEILTEAQEKEFKEDKESLEKVKSQIALVDDVDLEDDEEEEEENNSARFNKSKLSAAGKTTQSSGNRNAPGDPAKRQFESLDEWLETALSKPNDQRLEYVDVRSEQNAGTGVKGAIMIPTQFRAEILTITPDASLVRPRAKVIPAGTPPDAEIIIPALDQRVDANDNPMYGGVIIEKVEEGGLKPETDFNLRGISLKPSEMAARIPFTDKLLRNWAAATGWAGQLLRSSLNSFEDRQFVRGNGSGGPIGAAVSDAAYKVARALSNRIQFIDLKNIYARFRGDESKAVWVVSYSGFRQLMDITEDGGGATNIIKVDKATGNMTIYGIPVKKHPAAGTLGALADIGLYDFSYYLIKDGSGPIIETGYAQGQWERNKRSIKITWNVDGKPWLTAPFEDEENYAVSPIVVLDVPSGS